MAGSGSGFSESGSETLLTGMNVDNQIILEHGIISSELKRHLGKMVNRTVYTLSSFYVVSMLRYLFF
jgi:hypothetical protein